MTLSPRALKASALYCDKREMYKSALNQLNHKKLRITIVGHLKGKQIDFTRMLIS